MKRLIVFATLAAMVAMLFGSCVKRGDVKVLSVVDASIESMSRMSVTLKMENRSATKVTLREAKVTFNHGSSKILDLMVTEPVVINRKSIQEIEIPIRMKLSNPIAAMSIVQNFERNAKLLTISGEFTVKAGWARKKITFDKVPLSQIMTNFGLDINAIIDSIQM